MSRAEKSVYNYITSISSSEPDIVSNIGRFGLATALSDRLKSLDHRAYLHSQVRQVVQRNLNQVFERELLALSEECRRAGIRLVHLKGLSLAQDLYEPTEARVFGDIDALVEPEGIGTVIQLLRGMGYNVVGAQDLSSDDWLAPLFGSETQHHIVLTRSVSGVNVELELHYSLRSDMGVNVSTSDIVSRSVERSLSGRSIWVMELHDQLLYLMIHFAFHYSRLISAVPLRDVHPASELRRLHDIALLIEKYESSIDWDTVVEHAAQWNASVPTLCCLQLLRRIYGVSLSPDVIEGLSKCIGHETRLPRRPPLHEIVKMDCDDILTADMDRLVNDIHPRLSINNCLATCSPRCMPSTARESEIIIDEFSDPIPNRFQTHLRAGDKPASSSDCSARGRLSWDSGSLYVSVTVKDDVLVFGSPDDNPCAQDSVELFIYTKESRPLKRHIVLSPFLDSSGSRLRISSGAADVPGGSVSGFIGHCTVGDDYYEVHLKIPWEILGVTPYRGLRFWLDVVVNDWDDREQGRKSMMMWSGSRSYWIDITAFGNVVLT